MKPTSIIPFIAALAIASQCTHARADHTTPAASLLYLDQQQWQRASNGTKAALAADFMRIFCGNPAMPVADLVGCLDRAGEVGSVFGRAMACVTTAPVSQ